MDLEMGGSMFWEENDGWRGLTLTESKIYVNDIPETDMPSAMNVLFAMDK